MNTTEFDELTKLVWSPLLEGEFGFAFEKGGFCRELDGGIRQVILMDFDTGQARTFRIIVGFNSSFISGDLPPAEAGAFGVRYLDDQGLSSKPKNFPCFSQEAAEKSLSQTLHTALTVVMPWFANYKTAEDLVGVIEDQYPFIKGKLLFHAGQRDMAKKYLSTHMQYLARQQQSPSVVQGARETQEMLKFCI